MIGASVVPQGVLVLPRKRHSIVVAVNVIHLAVVSRALRCRGRGGNERPALAGY